MMSMLRVVVSAFFVAASTVGAAGQSPQPFPGASPPPPGPRSATPAPRTQAAPPQTRPPASQPSVPADPNAPSAATVGFPIFPGAQYLASYDAGKGQRYYLYGTTQPYAELVQWYQTQLRDRGDEVFAAPATHMFAQRFREETMAFPPGVTIKDWTSGGSQGYPNPKPGGAPVRFPVVIMIVPPPPGAAGR
jgi:hypothetical protein